MDYAMERRLKNIGWGLLIGILVILLCAVLANLIVSTERKNSAHVYQVSWPGHEPVIVHGSNQVNYVGYCGLSFVDENGVWYQCIVNAQIKQLK